MPTCKLLSFLQSPLFPWHHTLQRNGPRPLESDFLKPVALESECLHQTPKTKSFWPYYSVLTSQDSENYKRTHRSKGEGNGIPLQYSCLDNPMDGGAWQAAVHGVAKSWTRLSDFTFTFHFHALEKEMATHSSVLAWRIPGMGEPGRLPSMGSHRVGHD